MQSPSPADVEGTWEATNAFHFFPYGAIRFNKEGSGELVIVMGEDTGKVRLSDFVTEENSFLITVNNEEDKDPEQNRGSFLVQWPD